MDWPDRVGVVGGGIVGLATAYALATRARAAEGDADTDVVLFERGKLGSGTTRRAGCGLRTFYASRVNVRLSMAGLRFWRNADRLLDADVGFRENGYVFLTDDPDRASELERGVRRQRAYGGPAYACAPAELADRVPGLRADRYRRAVFAPTAALADPDRMVSALAAGAREAGADLRTNAPVEDLAVEGEGRERRDAGSRDARDAGARDAGGGVRLQTPGGTEHVDVAVNAAGAWAPAVAAQVGVELPVTPRRRRLVALDRAAPAGLPLTVDLDSGLYFLPGPEGRLLAGGHFGPADPAFDPDDPAAFEDSRDRAYERTLFEHGRRCTALFGDPDADPSGELCGDPDGAEVGVGVDRSWTGLYAMTDSRLPVIERVGPVVHAAGFSGHGIMQAPGAAQVVADLVGGQSPSLVPAGELSRDRPATAPDIQF